MPCSQSGTRPSATRTSTVSCPRCGLCRPEPFGSGIRCACCGLSYTMYTGPDVRAVRSGPATPCTGVRLPVRSPEYPETLPSAWQERDLWAG
jgi:hypothetical protein